MFFSKKIKLCALAVAFVSIVAIISSVPYVKAESDPDFSPVISNGYLRGVKENIIASQLREAYPVSTHGADYELRDKDGGGYISFSNIGHIVRTGDYIRDAKSNVYTVVVTGDIDSDGRISTTDAAALKMHFAGTITLENELLEAADSEPNGFVNATDYLRFKFHLQGIYNIYTNEVPDPDEPSSDSELYPDESQWTSGWL